MSRHTYELSDETRTVLTDNAQPIALEYPCTANYVQQILAGNETDCFAKFMHLYGACVRAGIDVTPWDASLSGIKARYRSKDKSVPDSFNEKLQGDTDTAKGLVTALEDGAIDAHERMPLLRLITRERDQLDVLESAISEPAVREKCRGLVKERKVRN